MDTTAIIAELKKFIETNILAGDINIDADTVLQDAGIRFVVVEDHHVILRSPGRLEIDAELFERRASLAIETGDVEACEAARAFATKWLGELAK